MTLQNFLQNIKHRGAYLVKNFEDWQFLAKQAMRSSIISIIDHFAESSFSDVTKV